MNPLVIIHGWSDDAESFVKLADWIKTQIHVQPIVIRLGDWISMHDEVTLADVAVALEKAWAQYALPTAPRSVDLIVHSTGSLVLREWMTRYKTPQTVPIHHLLMLAPANFGSPLAHKGHSFIGRVIKGWGEPGFQTGDKILKALELGSPYTYELAERDLFNPDATWYGPGGILCTVLMGDTGYSGIASIANEDGSDGTVRISTAHLNPARITLNLDENNQVKDYRIEAPDRPIAFGILAGENHSTVAFKDGGPKNDQTGDLILGALGATDDQWPGWIQHVAEKTQGGGDKVRFQHTVIRLRDDLGQRVPDYFVEFYRTGHSDDRFEQSLYQKFLESVHPYGDDPSHRALYLDINVLDKLRPRIDAEGGLHISFLASPSYTPGQPPDQARKQPVGYLPVPENATGGLRVLAAELDQVFAAHRTVLMDVRIHRQVDGVVFRVK